MNTQPNIDPLCYWVLLTNTLQFCYTSPSFNAVVPQASRLIGRGFLEYLNHSADPPDSIATRLHDSFHDEEDKGDVINLNYATVSAIRHHLQTGQFFADQPDYTFNTYSMVVSRAGGFILAFMHVKTEFSRDCNFHLYEPLKPGDLISVTQYLPSLDPNPPYHVFQILSDDERRPIIFTTPTTTSAGRVTISPSQLAEGTQNPRHSLTNQGVTSCTKRTKLSFIISTIEGQLLNVSCILIRHGNALLAMYRLTPYATPHQSSLPYEQNSAHPGAYDSQGPTGYRRVSLTSEGYSHSSPVTHSGSMNSISSPAYGQSYIHGTSSQMHRGSSFDSPYPPTSPDEMRSPMAVSPQSPISARGPQPRGIPMRRHSVVDHALSMSPTSQGSISSRIGSYEERRTGLQGIHSPGSIQSPTQPNFLLDHGRVPGTSQTDPSDLTGNALRGRPAKEPPKGVTCCRSCQTTVTPEWRKGPTGVKDMCNACGLRWNRRVKKFKGEGGESSFDALNLSIPEGESFLEPQRSGGGSKKGHRKKTAESKGPALTTRPQKQRRHSFVNTLSNESTLGGNVHDIPFTGGDSPHTQQYANHHHPHNPHYAQGNPSNNPRPSLPPLYDDGSATIDNGMHMRSQSLTSPLSVPGPPNIDRHQSGSVKQSMKRQSTPESPQALLHRHTSSSSSSGPPLSASSYSRPPQSPANGSHSDRTSIPIPGIATYPHSQEFRHD